MTSETDQPKDGDPNATKPRKEKKPRDVGSWVQRTFFPVKDIKDTAGMTKNMFTALIDGDKQIRQETFEEAVKRKKLSAEDLFAAYQRQRGGTFMFIGIAVLACLYLLYLLLTAQNVVDLSISILGLGPLSVLLAAAFRSSFRAWQIRNRRLGGFDEFLRARNQWWPTEIRKDHFNPGKGSGRKVATGAKKTASKARRART